MGVCAHVVFRFISDGVCYAIFSFKEIPDFIYICGEFRNEDFKSGIFYLVINVEKLPGKQVCKQKVLEQ
jgi:hypothetical protein